MAEEVTKCNFNNMLFLENSKIKKEFKDDSYIDVSETSISANDTKLKENVWNGKIKECNMANTENDIKIELSYEASNIVINKNVKMEMEIDPDHIKIEFDSKLLFCDHCSVHYEDYCTRCGMLSHILNGITLSTTNGRAIKGIPNDILEIRESSGHVGVFALKVIPESVKIGPFNGLSTSESPWRLKGGKLMVPEAKSNMLNWMQYISPARNIFQQNLIPLQHDDNLYYHCNREILVGEELLVYFGEEYEDSINKDIEMDFTAPAEDEVKDVFACIPCCLGFSSRGYLAKHKSTCPNEIIRRFSIDELTRCPCCNIYVYEKEYLESHMPYCCEKKFRSCIPLALDNQTVKVSRCKTQRLQMYKCIQCKYNTLYKSVLRSHFNKHYEVKMCKCEICSRQFKTKGSLKLHMKYKHIDIPKHQKCSMREYNSETHPKIKNFKKITYECKIHGYKTNKKSSLERHVKSIHLKQFSFECEICDYKTNLKSHLETHIKSKHLRQFSYECEVCDYKTNVKSSLEVHAKTKHLKEFSYECEKCDYKTNLKPSLETHVKSKHLKEFSYECEMCDYKTNRKSNLETHVKSKHLKQFSYECKICDYKTNQKSDLEKHVKSKHLKQFGYECDTCDYKTNKKANLVTHAKSKHLKQFSYECVICDYKTNRKLDLETHVKSKHLKQFSYECGLCDYKTNQKSNLETHVKTKHLKQFGYECEVCDYKTNKKSNLATHVKSIHLKQFSYECEICDYKTNQKPNLETHVKSKHLKQFSFRCDICDYKTNEKSNFKKHLKSKHLKGMQPRKMVGMKSLVYGSP